MNGNEREALLARLERLGGGDDADVLAAAREIAAQVAEQDLDWDELIEPEDPPGTDFAEDGPDEPEEDGGDADAEGEPLPEGDGSEEMALLDKLIARRTLAKETREELREMRGAAAEGGLDPMDRRYVRALAKRLG